ncbi:unnamed protein product [Sphagnum troendelagicum]|uniref:Uncharacterized protein n=1 Tax=Sphagnum troendelagicum TaxID=128251 RepID=A0ABP0UE01_9BRYO
MSAKTEGGISNATVQEEEEQIAADPAEIGPEISHKTSVKADYFAGEEGSQARDMKWIEGDEGKSARIFIDETENDPAADIISSVVYIKLPFSFLQEVHKRDTANIDKDVREKPIHSKVEETATKNGMHTSLEEAESKNTNQEDTSILQDPDDEIDLVAGYPLQMQLIAKDYCETIG